MKYHDGSTILPKLACPYCGYLHDAASPVDNSDATPGDGDISVCLACGEPSAFTGSETFGYGLRELTDQESQAAADDETITAATAAIQKLRLRPSWPKGPGRG